MRPIRTGCAALLGAAALTCSVPAAHASGLPDPDGAGFGVRVMAGPGDAGRGDSGDSGDSGTGDGEISSATSRPDPRASAAPEEVKGVKAGDGGGLTGDFDAGELGLGAALVAGGLAAAHRLTRRREEDGAG